VILDGLSEYVQITDTQRRIIMRNGGWGCTGRGDRGRRGGKVMADIGSPTRC